MQFPSIIEFRNSPVGRQAYMKNSNLAVWQVMMLADEYARDVAKIAKHLQKPVTWVKAAFNYTEAYPEEIDSAIKDDLAINYTTINRLLPQTELLLISIRYHGGRYPKLMLSFLLD